MIFVTDWQLIEFDLKITLRIINNSLSIPWFTCRQLIYYYMFIAQEAKEDKDYN